MYKLKVVSFDKKEYSKAFIDSVNNIIFPDLHNMTAYVETVTGIYPDTIIEVKCE